MQFSKSLFVGIDALARHRLRSILVIFLISFAGNLWWGSFRGIPVAYIEDEFAHLLTGDTFAHGRIVNPPHPMGEYFETFHILQQPAYASKYPPGQGIFMAVGQVVFGHPIYGIWLSAGLMCAAICWMLYALVSPRWALIGGFIAALQFGIFTYLSQSYFGGTVTALGGALVFGALPRIFKYQRLRDAVLMGLGIALLANSRPLEGILFGIPLGCLLLPWKIKWQSLNKRQLFRNVVLPLVLMVLAIAILTGAYNKKITGNALELPYVFYAKLYSTMPVFIWQPLYPAVHWDYRVLADYFRQCEVDYYYHKRSLQGFTQDMFQDSLRVGLFFLGFPLALPAGFIVMQLFLYRKIPARYLVALIIILFMFGMMTFPAKPHYFASLTCFVVLLLIAGLRGLFCLSIRQRQVGGAAVIFLIGLQLLLNIILTPQPGIRSLARSIQTTSIKLPASFTREELKNVLMKRGGKYLVIVQYPLTHNYFYEWVYNDADIDHSPIVWARSKDNGDNEKLLKYFKDRQVLFINVYWDKQGPVILSTRQ